MNSINLYLAVPPEHTDSAAAKGLPIAHMIYRIGRGLHLYRADQALRVQGGLMAIDDIGFAGGGSVSVLTNEIIRECRARNYRGIVLNLSQNPPPLLMALTEYLTKCAQENHLQLFVPEHLAYASPNSKVLICTALSGGTLSGHLQTAIETYGHSRVCLEIERVRMDFTLPARDGQGKPLSQQEIRTITARYRPTSFFSKELCTYYFTYKSGGESHFVLYDNTNSIRRKLQMGESLGIDAAFLFYPQVEDILSGITNR